MNKYLKIGIGIVVMMLAIGFASVTTNLILNNNVKLGFNESNFDIYFSSAIPEDDGTATIDSATKKTITYSTKTLKNVGDQAILDYVVTNASTQYDANCTVEFIIDSGADEYVTITKTGFVENESKVVNAQTSAGGRILITLKKVSMEPIQINFTLKLIFTPVGKEEESEPGQVPNNEDPTPSTCVPSGYYGIKCSCDDSTYIAWLDGPYKDINNVAMNPNRVRDINYPPTGTYICGCKNGQSGYVYNTGNLLESECPVEEPEPTDENSVTEYRIDNRLPYTYNFDVPGYDDETGNNLREYVTVDITTQYHNADVELIELDEYHEEYDDELQKNYIVDGNVITDSRTQYLGVNDKKYSYRITLKAPTSTEEMKYYYKIVLRSKTNPNVIYDTKYFDFGVVYEDTYDKESYEYEVTEWYCGKEYKEMDYRQGVRPWATWFMNDGRDDYCWIAECCE